MSTIESFRRWLALLVLALAAGGAFAQGATPAFDHLRTGFALTGEHTRVRCESCHLNGVFKGTPRDCASCHTSGKRFARSNVVMPPQHPPTQASCDTCHTTTTFVGAKFSHTGVTAGTCQNCHNGKTAAGKPAQHMPTGSSQSCDDCHKATSAWRPTAWNHTQLAVAGQCASCHSGAYPPADGKPSNHVPYQTIAAAASANCDACHKGSYTSWANGRFHANVNVTTGCASCHSGNSLGAAGKPSTPVHTGVTNCESCHSTSGWAGAKVDHATFNASTNCAQCHGPSASGKPAGHIPTTANCFTCHNVAPAKWTPTKWNHTQVAVSGQCASCHSGGYPPADGKPTNHIPYQSVAVSASANCDACHKGSYTTWANGAFHANYSVGTGCFSCHTGAYLNAAGKPNTATHANVTGNCESCHKSTTNWSAASVDHSTFTAATNCSQCHGVTASGKPATHIPTTANCFTCHNVAPAKWTPTKWNHTQLPVTGQCASCHSGGYPPADGRPGNHIPYQTVAVSANANCDGCHKGSYTTWANGAFHANYSVASGCFSCHTGAYLNAVGKPNTATHANVTGNCESCHKSTTSWAATIDHSTFTAATNCSQCHGVTASGKPATHIPTTANCFLCHNVAPAKWTPTKWNHTQLPVTAQCATCHTGGYPPADGRPANHIPYQTVAVAAGANCDGCHKGSFTTWANGRFHSNYTVSTGCFSCHTGAYLNAVGKPNTATHANVTGNCESCHKSTTSWSASVDHSTFTAATNCSQCHGVTATGKPATHIPTTANCFLCHNVAPQGWTPTKWNHTQLPVTAQCASCHTGGYPPADGRPTNHIPYQSVAVSASANCDACHKGSYTTWANGLFHSSFSVSAGCFSCHTGTYLNAVGKPNTATHANVTGNCESCHKSTTSWSSATVDHSTFTAATNCSQCHGVTASGKPATHIPTTANCYLCHNVAPAKWTPTKWNHTQLPVTSQCASCHTGGYPPADGKPANHIPYQTVAVTAAANCDGCHKGSFTTWANGRFHSYYSVSTGCFSCHTGAYLNAVGKPNTATHANVTGNCETCHKSTTSWAASVDHSTFTAATNCSQCHGVTASGKPATHIPTTANCFLCHNVAPQGWTPTKWNHTQLPVTAQCATCHTGGYPPADGKPVNHIPYQTVPVSAAANCDGCHKGSFTTWANGKFHSYYSVSTGCFSCHTGTYLNAVGKPNTATHATVTGNCESCHKSTTSWSASVDHSTFTAATNCSQCHGVTASGKPATHIPTTANCYLCHNVAPAKWTPTKWNHTQVPVVAQCATCHTGGYPPADGKPANHIPYQTVPVTATANCDSCHKGSYTTWANGKFHSYYTVSTGCRSCHTGAYLNARGKPSNHIPEVQLLNGASMDCNACHTSTAAWTTMTMNHNGSQGSGAGWCKACHQSGTAWLGSMTRMSLTHRSASAIDCSQSGCHRPLGTKGTTYINWD